MQRQASTAGFASVRGKSSKVVDLSKGTVSPTKSVDVSLLKSDELVLLKGLRYTNDLPIIDPIANIGNEIYYEILNRMINSNFNSIYIYLTHRTWQDENDLYFNFPEFENAKYRFLKYLEVYHDEKEMVRGLYKCKYCKSDNTYTVEKQTRSGDEPAAVRVVCVDCGNGWKL